MRSTLPTRKQPRKQRGFSLLALAIWMIVLGLAVAIVLALLPNRSDQTRIEKTIVTIGDAQDALLSFVVENNRLPAPDSDNDGAENTGAATGAVPYRDMALPTELRDQASILLRYTPFKATGATPVDLTVATALYAPGLPTASDFTDLDALFPSTLAVPTFDPPAPTLTTCLPAASPVNLLDFCTALENAITASDPVVATSVNVGLGAGTTNVAYAILSGGLEDADGNVADRSLDGLNDDGNVTYEDPARGRGFAYDDIVRASRFSTLQRQLSCRALIDSVDLLAAVAQSSKGVFAAALVAYGTAETQVAMANVSVLMDIIAIAQTVQSAIGIASDIAKSCATCAASLGTVVTCCVACGANIAAAVVYAVTAVAQIAALVVDAVALADATENRNLFRSAIIPRANDHLCSAIAETTAADDRGGLASKVVP